jgi:hypothetical protein
MKNKGAFALYLTDANGNKVGTEYRKDYFNMRTALALIFSHTKVSQVQHWLDLAVVAKGHEIDCTEWKEGALVKSARLQYYSD